MAVDPQTSSRQEISVATQQLETALHEKSQNESWVLLNAETAKSKAQGLNRHSTVVRILEDGVEKRKAEVSRHVCRPTRNFP